MQGDDCRYQGILCVLLPIFTKESSSLENPTHVGNTVIAVLFALRTELKRIYFARLCASRATGLLHPAVVRHNYRRQPEVEKPLSGTLISFYLGTRYGDEMERLALPPFYNFKTE